jgi:hypothetical protein
MSMPAMPMSKGESSNGQTEHLNQGFALANLSIQIWVHLTMISNSIAFAPKAKTANNKNQQGLVSAGT